MMLIQDQIDEADEFVNGMLDLLQRSVASPLGMPAYGLRAAIGYLRTNVEKSIRQRTIGTDIGACFNAATKAGAIPERLDGVRRYIVDKTFTDYQGIITHFIGGYSLFMCLSVMCQQGLTVVYKSQDEVAIIIARTQVIFQQAKDLAADQTPVEVYNALNKLASTVTRYLAKTKLQLPRVVIYQTATTLPSLALSNLIFRVGDRADEIVDENDIIHPAFCLRELRVLSK
jgi:hypothetical protein